MSEGTSPASVRIGRISVQGIDARQARNIGPAIQAALADAVRDGLVPPGDRRSLNLDLRHGASARQIADAVVRALARPR